METHFVQLDGDHYCIILSSFKGLISLDGCTELNMTNREDSRSSTCHVRTEADLTRLLCVERVPKNYFLDQKQDTGLKRHLVLPETSDMPCRMTAGIRIISPLQRDDGDPELMMCVMCQGGIEKSPTVVDC